MEKSVIGAITTQAASGWARSPGLDKGRPRYAGQNDPKFGVKINPVGFSNPLETRHVA